MNTLSQDRPGLVSSDSRTVESSTSAVSWSAVFAGAAVATAATLVLIGLGSGLGLASISPWPNSGASATTFTVMTAIWFIVVQWLSSGLGGYVTGRLRTRWVGTHTHEVFFRDTAHGFVTWSVATVIVVGFLASAVSSVVGNGVHAASAVASGAALGAAGNSTAGASGSSQMGSSVTPYDVDTLFRSAHPDSTSSSSDARAETNRILAKGAATGDVPSADRAYLADLVATRTGISQEEARKRVDDVIAQVKAAEDKARQAADTARKSAATAAIFTALSMLVGAFIACIAAALGGQRRDLHP
jgi:hypothetical protein